MAAIKKKIIGKQEYYYLEHSFRKDGKVRKLERYLGKEIPKEIDELKKKFVTEIYQEKWDQTLNKIQANFSKQEKKSPAFAKEKEKETFSIRFTYDTNRIEGSKLTLRETAELLEKGLTPKSKSTRDIKEAEAHQKIFYEVIDYKKELSLQIVLYWHKKLFEQTKPEIAGKIRNYQVKISGSKFMPPFPAELQPLLNEFFEWYSKVKTKINPVELAALVHLKFVTMHPFGDGNGRISRLLMNFVLNKHNFPLFNILYENRSGYYTALERAQIKNEKWIFAQWFIKRYIKENRNYLK